MVELLPRPLIVGMKLWMRQTPMLPPVEPMLRKAFLMMAVTPMLCVHPTLAQSYRTRHTATRALLVTTLAPFLNLSMVL